MISDAHHAAIFNPELIEKYNRQGPRYTSYPTAVEFVDETLATHYAELLTASNQGQRQLSLYVHIPFCDTVCYYCACNKIITKNKQHAAPYLQYLEKEIRLQAQYLDTQRPVIQLHWGGGTPTFLSLAEQQQLNELLRSQFHFLPDDQGEYSIEIDPRTVDRPGIAALREMGFNRLSFGVQDFDNRVQLATNRIQPYADTRAVIEAGRDYGFHSISVDLIYGLPLQSVDSFAKTLDKTIALSPDRIAVFNYAHLPHIFKTQKQIQEADLPSGEVKLQLLALSIEKLTDAGYIFIGLDHFAKPDDALVKHQNAGTLYRNFQGYSTFSECDLLGFGMSSISMLDTCYAQNIKDKEGYYQALDAGQLPIYRGVRLSQDDMIRRKVITEIMCNMSLDLAELSTRFDVDAKAYFADEWQALEPLAADGLIALDSQTLSVLPPGRLLIRNICMIFDVYLQAQHGKGFSKVI